MSAAAELGADSGCIVARHCPHGDFYPVFTVFPNSSGDFDPLNTPGEAGNVLQIVFRQTQLLFYSLGQGADGNLALLQEKHMLNEPAFQTQPTQATGLKQRLIDGK